MEFNGKTIEEKSLGGSETAAYYMARELARRGNKVTVFTNTKEEGKWDGVQYLNLGEISKEAPLGNRFQYYACCTPHDVCIIQRSAYAFTKNIKSKINLLWLHDLAMKDQEAAFMSQMVNVDGVLTVSQYHKEQILTQWGMSPEIIFPITNGIDLDAFLERSTVNATGEVHLLYTSRPERGLENLVRKNGILDIIKDKDPNNTYTLHTAFYDNVAPHMQDYYQYLEGLCSGRGVLHHGALSKSDLYKLMSECHMMVYPTEFLEVSCITAMECMGAGLPFVSSACGALPETCKASRGSYLVPLSNGLVDLGAVSDRIMYSLNGSTKLVSASTYQKESAKEYSWFNACERLMRVVNNIKDAKRSTASMIKEMYSNSDIIALRRFLDKSGGVDRQDAHVILRKYPFLSTCGGPGPISPKEHYLTHHTTSDLQREDLRGGTRYGFTAQLIKEALKDESYGVYNNVLDFGCSHGHYTVNLARDFPNLNFTGVDFMSRLVEFAGEWSDTEGLDNTQFFTSEEFFANKTDRLFDVIMLQEILEHVEKPWELVNALLPYLKIGGRLIVSTPYGPWEHLEFNGIFKNYREHIWHFERDDLREMFYSFEKKKLFFLYVTDSPQGKVLGNYMSSIQLTDSSARAQPVDLDRKLAALIPSTETVSACILLGPSETSLLRMLESIDSISDEYIFAVDPKITGNNRKIAQDFCEDRGKPAIFFDYEGPLQNGFDVARNRTVELAGCDWILWVDADEKIVGSDKLVPYIRNNMFNAYGIDQKHLSHEPLEVLAIDKPTRLFRSDRGIKFLGVIHEHPEMGENKGIDFVSLISEAFILHDAYENEVIRKKRFYRNFPLMARDREKYPNRTLGKFLWIRDTSHLIGYRKEAGKDSEFLKPDMLKCMGYFDELIDTNFRYAIDCLKFYNLIVYTLGGGLHFKVTVRGAIIEALFYTPEHRDKFVLRLAKEGSEYVSAP